MTIRAQFPAIRPSLDLNFARTRALDPRITFTRASTATFVGSNGLIQTAASGAARFDHNPSTGESLGLLVEEARTNLVRYSEDFSQTSQWSVSSSSFATASSITAPDGSTNAYKLVESAATGSHNARCLPSNQCIAGTTYTYSMFAKAAERTQILLHFDAEANSNVIFDLSSGDIVSGTIGTIKAVGNGWYYCSVTLQPASNTEPKFYTAVNGSFSTTGDGVSGVYVWGAQLEQASFSTSYIPTSGATVTRAADVATIQGSNWLNIWNVGGAGNSIFAEGTIAYTTTAPFPGGPVMYAMDGDTGGGTAKLWYSYLEASRGPIDGTGGGGGAVELFHGGVTSRGPGTFKSCMTFDVPNDRLKSSWNTVLSAAANNAAYFNSMWALGANPRLTIGGKDLGSNRRAWCGCIKRMSIYSVGLPDAQLQELTR